MWKRIRTALLLLLLAGAGMALFVWRTKANETTLLDRAQKVADLTDADVQHVWLSDHELLTENTNGDARHLTLRDFHAHTKTVPAALNRLYKKEPHNEGLIASPDCQWLMLIPFDGNPDLRILHRDGSREISLDVSGNTRAKWMPDSRRWAEILVHDPKAKDGVDSDSLDARWIVIHSLPFASTDRPIPLKPTLAEETFTFLGASMDDTLFFLHEAVHPSTELPNSNSGEQAQTDRGEHADKLLAYRVDAHEARQTAAYPLPNYNIAPIYAPPALSPNGKRLLWLQQQQQTSPLMTWLHRWLPAIGDKSQLRIIVWTSQLDGSKQQELGQLLLRPDANDLVFNSLQWLPDNRHISFRYNDDVYTLDVDAAR